MRAGEPAALRAILDRAAAESRALRHGYIGSEHLLLALLGAAGSRAAERLEAAGGRYEEVSALIVRIVGRGDEQIPEQICRTPRTQQLSFARSARRPSGQTLTRSAPSTSSVPFFSGATRLRSGSSETAPSTHADWRMGSGVRDLAYCEQAKTTARRSARCSSRRDGSFRVPTRPAVVSRAPTRAPSPSAPRTPAV